MRRFTDFFDGSFRKQMTESNPINLKTIGGYNLCGNENVPMLILRRYFKSEKPTRNLRVRNLLCNQLNAKKSLGW